MTQEDKELLLKDLSARLPYGVKVYVGEDLAMTLKQIDYKGFCESWENEDFKCHSRWMLSYLRPMSSMTEEERKEYKGFIIHREHVNAQGQEWDIDCFSFDTAPRLIDWLNTHHFDYRGLIKKGLAIEASEGMYNITK